MMNKKCPLQCVFFLVVALVVMSILSPRTESLGGSGSGSGSGTTSGSSGGSSNINSYLFQGQLLNIQKARALDGSHRLSSVWNNCSPESNPHGCSVPEMSLTAPARGPFPYPMNW